MNEREILDLSFQLFYAEARIATKVIRVHPYLVIFGPIMRNHLYIPKTEIMGALLVASGPRNSCMNFHPDWT